MSNTPKHKFLVKLAFLEKKYRRLLYYTPIIVLTISVSFLRKENLNAKVQITSLSSEVKLLKANALSYNRTFEAFPMPVWEKVKRGSKFIMQYLNPEYVKVFGHIFNYDRYQIIGKNNFQLGYPDAVAQKYLENDITVAITGKPLKSIENYPNIDGIYHDLKVVKWREIRNKDTIVNGMVLDILEK